jgi:hypothetical protein
MRPDLKALHGVRRGIATASRRRGRSVSSVITACEAVMHEKRTKITDNFVTVGDNTN